MDETRGEDQEIENIDEVDELESTSGLSSEDGDKVPQPEPHLVTIVAIAELLEVALHTILYVRQIYPIEVFERRVKFGISVFQCIDASINEYISEAIQAVSDEIAEDTVARVVISIHQSEIPLEKFIFSFDSIKGSDGEGPDADIIPLDVVQRQMRAMLVKLNAIDAQLLPVDAYDDLSFSFVMQLREGGAFRISEDDLNFDAPDESSDEKRRQERLPEAFLIRDPALVHVIRTGRLSVSLHVQESGAKGLPIASKVPKIDNEEEPEDGNKNEDDSGSPEDSP